jgi:hypothetical protein
VAVAAGEPQAAQEELRQAQQQQVA